MIKETVLNKIIDAINKAIKEEKLGELKELAPNNLTVEKPKNPDFGDFAINVSSLARYAKMAPAAIAEAIAEYIDISDTQINIVAGFINIKLGESWLNAVIKAIIKQKDAYGSNNYGQNEKVLLEYISANPTGPLHIGHGRWAAMGSSLAELMTFCGYDVDQEFYINDAGSQIGNLAKSLWIRVLQELGHDVAIPTEGESAKGYYPGEYLIDCAKDYLKDNKEKAVEYAKNNEAYNPCESLISEMAEFAKADMLCQQKRLLERLHVNFKTFYKETSLHNSGEVDDCVKKLSDKGDMYEFDGALWFKTTKYGDDQDRVIKKKDGSNTYLTADIAYHYDKLKRGYERLINIWGADHHGYVARIKAAIEALGYSPDKLEVLLGQLVNIIIGGEQVRMGKRKKMITLEELVDEVGVDATRFWMIMRTIDTTLDFDIDLAKSSSDENPVFYVQYAHARACSILRNATSPRFDQDTKEELSPFLTEAQMDKITDPNNSEVDLQALWQDDEKATSATKQLILKLESFNDLIFNAVKARAPYMIARYVQELAGDFHHFYAFSRVLNVEEPVMMARLSLVAATKQILSNGLNLLGVSAPEKM